MQVRTSKKTFSDTALAVLQKRILRRDERGTLVESPEEMFSRVAREIAKVERNYLPEAEVQQIYEAFHDLMASLDFLPNSPTLVNAGLPSGQLAGCFVLPIEDSMESIFGTLKDMALIQKSGGGTGFSFSRLRPRNDWIESTRGQSSGPVSFMRLYDYACQTNRLGGVRSGANMGVMRFNHPDILEFIESKNAQDSLQTFNISVGVTDGFMDCVRRSAEYPLINPHTRQGSGRLNARYVFDLIVEAAWKSGDPGLVFLDAINRTNPTPLLGEIEATNPCGEQPLLPYESCNLGSINVSRFVRSGSVDYDRLAIVVAHAVHFLDNVLDANSYPVEAVRHVTLGNRKIGLGIMGFADLLVELRIPYASQDAVSLAEELMGFVQQHARLASAKLARSRNPFPTFAKSRLAESSPEPLR